MKLNRKNHPGSDRLRPLPGWLEVPLTHGIGRSAIEVRMSSRSPDADLFHTAVREDVDEETRGAFDASLARRVRITRVDLITAPGTRPLGDALGGGPRRGYGTCDGT